MKRNTRIFFNALMLIAFLGCENEPVDLTKLAEEPSPQDLNSTGLSNSCATIYENALPLPLIEISTTLTPIEDLSEFMPPVRSQGSQGSCTAWATAYYLKSYQEKIQYGYDYSTFDNVMSPAFVYNQSKELGGCNVGSCIENALYILKTKGTNTWADFPYDQNNCTLIPSTEQYQAANKNKISNYYSVIPIIEGGSYSLLNILKTFISEGTPIIIGMKTDKNFTKAIPKTNTGTYIYKEHNPQQDHGNHAMLIVGYNDELNAFKVVNSWGSDWANNGYCYISYDFFRNNSNPNYKDGLVSVHVAFDEEYL